MGIKCECGSDLVWGSDWDYEDYGIDGEGIATIYSCKNDDCNVESIEVFRKIKND